MTNRVTRYTQPCVQTQPGHEFSVDEVPLFEDPKGKWVRWEDYASLLNAYDQMVRHHAKAHGVAVVEPKAKLTLFEAQTTTCTGCGLTIYACQCPSEKWKAESRAEWRPIDTAPKSGKWVLLWWPFVTDAPFAGYYANGDWHGATNDSRETWSVGPTHWQPLPDGPAVNRKR